jgi:hypothetical protein
MHGPVWGYECGVTRALAWKRAETHTLVTPS